MSQDLFCAHIGCVKSVKECWQWLPSGEWFCDQHMMEILRAMGFTEIEIRPDETRKELAIATVK